MIELSDLNLNTYFSQYDTKHIDKTGKEPVTFTFVDNLKDALVVTVGCSWTWGANMTPDDNILHRLEHNFGRVLAEELQADWLCLAQVGTGNFWLYQKVQEFVKLIPELKYKKIYIICTLTEVGRQVATELDAHIDYKEFFKTNKHNNILEHLNKHVVEQLITAIAPYDNVTLRIGTNFVNPIGVDYAGDYLIPDTWLSILCNSTGTEYIGIAHTVSHMAIDRLKELRKYAHDQFGYTMWLTDLIEQGNKRIDLCQQCNLLMPGTGHPGVNGHRIWAKHILKTINDK